MTPNLPPAVAHAIRLAIASTAADYKRWAEQQLDLIEEADGKDAAARNARQYLRNGRGAKVFLKREVHNLEKFEQKALAEVARNPDGLTAHCQLELARQLLTDARKRHAAGAIATGGESSAPPVGIAPAPSKPVTPPPRPASLPTEQGVRERVLAQQAARRETTRTQAKG